MIALTSNSPDLTPEYERLNDTMVIQDEHIPAIKAVVRHISANMETYDAVSLVTPNKIPSEIIGVIHYRESNCNFNTHFFNGDSLQDYTKHYPAGYPKSMGLPPFKWMESCLAALQYRKMTSIKTWSLAQILFTLESYNGLGYRNYHSEIYSPYLWSFTNHYKTGKYVEIPVGGTYKTVFDINKVDKQVGCAPLYRYLTDKTLQ